MRLSALEAAAPPSLVTAKQLTRADSPMRRRLLWITGIAITLALLVVTPPLVNANRYRLRIAESMSRSLGRPVHLDNVSLHLLPTLGFTLQNLVVSEDPAFGAEPTIRANTVEATLRVSSLWRRPVEFSTVRFVEPSVNLVRDATGSWNLSEVLLHASRVDSAPTTQGRAGPAPRFPYIEATGGRVNVKFGLEKLPFSLTGADFALWLPSPRQWRVRLVGHPARTDMDVTDPGTVRVEGELQRATTVMEIPVDLRASWHDAPLGEATRILAGVDWGWRGVLNADVSLAGKLGEARLTTRVSVGGLRRSDFFPAQPLDLQLSCGSGFALHPATLADARCSLPDDGPRPLVLLAQAVHVQGLGSAPVTVVGDAIPVRWALLWAGLFSARVPTKLHPGGTMDVRLGRNTGSFALLQSYAGLPDEAGASAPSGWSGTVRLNLPRSPETSLEPENQLVWQVTPAADVAGSAAWPALILPSTPVTLDSVSTLNLSGSVGASGYTLNVAGSAPLAVLSAPVRYLPQLGDGLADILPTESGNMEPVPAAFTCTRSWSAAQTCARLAPAAAPRLRAPLRR